MSENPYQRLNSREIYANRWIQLREDDVIRPGGESGKFGVVTMRSGSSVLAVNKDQEVYLVKEYKYAVGRDSIEVISGAIEDGEPPLTAAKRELLEEAGLESGRWLDLGHVDPFTTVIRSPNYLFLALDVVEGESRPDAGEVLEVMKMPFAKALEMVMKGEITHAASCVLLLKAAIILNPE